VKVDRPDNSISLTVLDSRVPRNRVFSRIVGYSLHLAPFSRTGKMPVPQKINFLVEQAGKPVHKSLIENGAISKLQPTTTAKTRFL